MRAKAGWPIILSNISGMFPSMNRLLLVCRTAEARKAVEVCGMAGCSMLSAMPLHQFLFSIPEFFPFRPKGYHARGGIVVLSGGSPSSPWGATQAEGVAEAVRSIHFSGMATDPLAYLAAGGVFVVGRPRFAPISRQRRCADAGQEPARDRSLVQTFAS